MNDPADRDLERLFALDDAPGPARPIDDARVASIIAGALGGAGFPPPGAGGTGGAGGAQPITAGATKGLGAAKLALIAGGAIVAIAAVAWLATRTPREPSAPLAQTTSPAPAPPRGPTPPAAVDPAAIPPASDRPSGANDRGAPEAEGVVEPGAPEAEGVVEPAVAPALPPARSTDRAIGSGGPARHPPGKHTGSPRAPRPARTEPAIATTPRPAAAPEANAPDDLLAEANAARVAHRWRDADALYARVVSATHTDLAAQTALVASASLHLEHLGDPSGAARRFRAALAAGPRDPLAEDARWGLVEAARALDDASAERRALDDFLSHHAASALAPRARARRLALGVAP